MLKCSNLFNTLDSRGAISVTERVGVIQRVRKLAVGVAQAWADQQGGGAMSLPFLLEIGTEEIPDWMIAGALESLRAQFQDLGIAARMDATPRRLTARAEGLPERLPDSEERVMGPPQRGQSQSRRGLRAQARRGAWRPQSGIHRKGEYYTYTAQGRRPPA